MGEAKDQPEEAPVPVGDTKDDNEFVGAGVPLPEDYDGPFLPCRMNE